MEAAAQRDQRRNFLSCCGHRTSSAELDGFRPIRRRICNCGST